MLSIEVGILILLATVLLEDIQETIAHHGGGIFGGWWFAEDRWRHKYKNWEVSTAWEDRKWWARWGGAAFIDLWHLAKTIRVVIFCLLLVQAAAWPWWAIPVCWVAYGRIHDRVFYGRLLK